MRWRTSLVLVTGLLVVTGAAPGPRAAPGARSPQAAELADKLRRLYAAPGDPGERWRRRPPEVELEDGTRAPRESAYRNRTDFVAAAETLLASSAGDDGPLGAWLLGTASPERRGEAAAALQGALRHEDARVRFEAARALGEVGGAAVVSLLQSRAKEGGAAESGAALWSLRRIAEREGGGAAVLAPAEHPGLFEGFCRGVNWWLEEDRGDDGAASFRAVAALGVDFVSIHTWDPLQRAPHSPEWAEPRRPPTIPNLKALVKNAHAAGLKVMVKPHLEMRGYEPTPEEMRVWRSGDAGARKKLRERIQKEMDSRPRVWHNDIEMKTDADWRAWFARYDAYIVSYAREAAAAGADAFCVGRETDKAAVLREGDWRRLIARVREVFKGALTYSSNFDGYARIPFWDALDVIGISAYFPLGDDPAAAWDAILDPLEAVSRKLNRRVVFTEIGYPAVAGAARRPWEEPGGAADVWVQAGLYDAALRAVAKRPFLVGTFFWLWEGVGRPAFRDPSFTIQDKPAAFVMARYYLAPPGSTTPPLSGRAARPVRP